MGYFVVFLAFLLFFLVLSCYSLRNKNGLATNWPLVGMVPALLKNIHRLHDYLVEIFERTKSTIFFKGPWFTHINMLVTVDPANVHHIMTKNFSNYYKGPKFIERFDVVGESTITGDFDIGLYYRRVAHSFMSDPLFHQFFITKIWEKVEMGLVPVLNLVSKRGVAIDLQDLFARFTFDVMCTMIMDYDPKSLSTDLPSVPSSSALDDLSKAIFRRFVVPTCIWKFQRWLGVGIEKKHKKAWQTLDTFIYKCIARKREAIKSKMPRNTKENPYEGADIFTLYMDDHGNATNCDNKGDKFLRDITISLLFAGRDTTTSALSWFFYLLSKSPRVLSKIREELDATIIAPTKGNDNDQNGQHIYVSPNFKELNDKLVYLHAALCESLRLYPPIAWETKIAVEPDILPSGHHVDPNMQIHVDLYAMGRMKSIWGDDCYDFKPERWITETGNLKHEPSYKFMAFMAGPRACLGKQMAFSQMKAVASTIIRNYDIKVVEGHLVEPDISFVLRMKYGFKAKILSTSS